MYDKTITIFNYFESKGGAAWYPHIIPDVDLSTDIGSILKKYGPGSTDRVELHIAYAERSGQKVIVDNDGAELPWMPPKEWSEQIESELLNSITFGPDDFFMAGVWEDGLINEDDYPDGFYNFVNSQYDFVYKVSSIGGPYALIPHFEILGK